MQSSMLVDIMKRIAQEKDYGRGEEHIQAALRYSLDIYDGLVKERLIGGEPRDAELLKAACYIHDVGVKVTDGDLGVKILPEDEHNVKGFKWLIPRLEMEDCRDMMTSSEKTIVKYCVLWHKGNAWEIRPELTIDWHPLLRARVLAAVLRVGDAIASSLKERVQTISISSSGNGLIIEVHPRKQGDILNTELRKANEVKKDLLVAVMKAMSFKKIDDVQIAVA